MESEESKQYVEAIKVAAGSVQYKDISVNNTFITAVSQLYKYYEYSNNSNYLEVAILHIQAYLEMGFPYEAGSKIFDTVLKELGTTREMKFPKRFYSSKQVKVNKTQVRSMIKKWPASPKQKIKIDDVVSDIIEKVLKNEQGIYYYKCAIINDVYELVITDKETFFHDLTRGIFYTFVGV